MKRFSSSLSTIAAAVAVASALLAAPLAAQAQDTQRARVIVSYKAGSAADLRAVVAKLGGKVEVDLDEVDAMAVTLPRGALALLKASRNVESIEADSVRKVMGGRAARTAAPSTAVTSTQVVPYGITAVQADQLPAGASWVPTVCIVDSGINATHEDLAGNTMAGKNFTTSGTWDSDEASHGTHVAGTIAARNNSVGVVGVAPAGEVKLYISKVFDAAGSSPTSTIVKGMLGCLKGKANVVSMSLGGAGASSLEQKVVTLLANRGMLLIAASGNDGTSGISYPAGFAEVMSVAAVDEAKTWATFSQFNAEVEISGPGVAVLSSVPLGSQTGATTTVGASSYPVLPMDGSPRTSVTGPLADFGFGDTPAAGSMTGKVCLISRGNISFADKVLNCQTSGGIGAVIYNNTTGELAGTMGTTVTTIPSVGALQSDGATMLGQVGQSSAVAVFGTNDIYAEYSGTSMATPHVSAVAARVWSYFPSCTAEQIRSTLKKSALDLDVAGRDDKTGAGLVQAKAAYDRIATMGCAN